MDKNMAGTIFLFNSPLTGVYKHQSKSLAWTVGYWSYSWISCGIRDTPSKQADAACTMHVQILQERLDMIGLRQESQGTNIQGVPP